MTLDACATLTQPCVASACGLLVELLTGPFNAFTVRAVPLVLPLPSGLRSSNTSRCLPVGFRQPRNITIVRGE